MPMSKLEKLSPKQEKIMIETRDFWNDYIFSCKNSINKNKAKINIEWLYDMIQLEGFCIVSNMPERIERLNGKLHCANNSAIKFRDGYELFYWKGVNIPGFWISTPEQITSEVIMNEKNAEKRRCLFEILGAEKFSELLGVSIVDDDVDQHKNSIKLYRTKQKDEIAGEYIQFARVVCPSTLREYFLCVPETIRNVWDAVAWTFGKTKDSYKPIIETQKYDL